MKKFLMNAGASALGIAVGVGVCFGVAVATAGPATAEPVDLISEGAADLAVLGEGRAASLPAEIDLDDLGPHGILPESVRSLGSTQDGEFFIGVGNDGLICLISFIPGPDWTAGSSCSTSQAFATNGLGLQTFASGAERGVADLALEAYVLPDSAAEEGRARSAAEPNVDGLGTNLVIVDPYLSPEDRAGLADELGELPISVLPEPVVAFESAGN
jgi:hypothetical protein